jgi:hypothetical protein
VSGTGRIEQMDRAVTPDDNLVFEVLRQVDPVKLATVSCVSSKSRSMASNEALRENLCAKQWSSAKDDDMKSILFAIGGFKKIHAECYPLIVNRAQPVIREEDDIAGTPRS